MTVDHYDKITSEIFETVGKLLPQFNKFLISEYRQNMFHEMPERVARLFQTLLVDNVKGLRLVGYRNQSPIEILEYKLSRQTKATQLSINENYLRLVEYTFECVVYREDSTDTYKKSLSVYLWLPFLHPTEQHTAVFGSRYYPIFNIADNCVSRRKSDKKTSSPNMDLLHVPTAMFRVTFKYGDSRSKFTDTMGRVWAFGVPKMKAHGKVANPTVPVLLYPLARYGLRRVMDHFGFEDTFIFVVAESDNNNKEFVYFPVANIGYIAVHIRYLKTQNQSRVIGSLLLILKQTPPLDIRNLYSKDTPLWKGILGDYIHDSKGWTEQKFTQAQKHLHTCDRMVGVEECRSLSYDDIHVKDFYDLCYCMINTIDVVLSSGNSKDLFKKRLLYEEQYFKVLIHQINHIVFNYGHREEYLKDHEFSLKGLFKGWQVGTLTKYLYRMPYLFTALGEQPHSNWLLGPGKKKFRSETIKNPVNKNDNTSNHVDTKSNPSTYAHPSQLVVESILTLPSSNPIIAGSINVFAEIDESGRFIKPADYNLIEDVFDS